MRPFFLGILSLIYMLISLSPVWADKSAAVLLYHRFGEDSIPSTNIRLDQFEAHIKILKEGGYHFMALSDAIKYLKEKRDFPERTVLITVDDAYKSVFTNGWPILKAAGIPLTVFVSTDPVDSGSSNYMTWDDIRQLKEEGVEIAHHTASHLHMVHAGLETAMADVRRASRRFEEELGEVPRIFAYPYGEHSLDIAEAIREEGFDAAFAQNSGAMAQWDNLYALPRFPVNERYGGESRFKLISQAMALPVSDIIPTGPLLKDTTNPPLFGFSVDENIRGLGALACYPSHLGEAASLVKPQNHRIEVRFDKPFPKGRSRINCTMPAGNGRWYWLGKFFLLPGGKLD